MFSKLLSKEDNNKIEDWIKTNRCPLFISGSEGTGKSYLAKELLTKYHVIHINSEHIKCSSDTFQELCSSLKRKDIFMMISSNNQFKALLVDDLQLFSKYDKSMLSKILKLSKELVNSNVPIIFISSPNTDKIITQMKNMSTVVSVEPNTSVYRNICKSHNHELSSYKIKSILKKNDNIHSLLSKLGTNESSKDTSYTTESLHKTLLYDDHTLHDLLRLCASEYSVLSLNIIENIPKLMKYLDIQTIYTIYRSICFDDFLEYKYMNYNVDINVRLFFSCAFPLKQLKKRPLLNKPFKYNSYISRSMIQIHNQNILKGDGNDYLYILNLIWNTKLNDKHELVYKLKPLVNDINKLTMDKQIKVYNYYYNKTLTKKYVNKILKEVNAS